WSPTVTTAQAKDIPCGGGIALPTLGLALLTRATATRSADPAGSRPVGLRVMGIGCSWPRPGGGGQVAAEAGVILRARGNLVRFGNCGQITGDGNDAATVQVCDRFGGRGQGRGDLQHRVAGVLPGPDRGAEPGFGRGGDGGC